jgi:hypothetical protein
MAHEEWTPGPCRRTECPRGCGWFRDANDGPQWRGYAIDHPLYGPVTLAGLADRDIAAHDCAQYAMARARLPRHWTRTAAMVTASDRRS